MLTVNNLRERVILRTDGGLRTGRDIVIAAMLGAQEFGIGTAALIAMGCIMVRQCQSNTCPVGVCTQDPALRAKFTGTADKVVNLMSFYAQEVREVLASVGARSIDEVIGRADLLTQVSRGAEHLDDLDLNPLLIKVDQGEPVELRPEEAAQRGAGHAGRAGRAGRRAVLQGRREDAALLRGAEHAALDRDAGVEPYRPALRDEDNGLQPDHLTIKLAGLAPGSRSGPSRRPGLKIEVMGEANDYVGKGLSGGIIVVRPPLGSPLVTHENAIIGNTVLYGATAGSLFAGGRAGERFCVRNSGAEVVVEGCGSNGCEYMTGGVAVILGRFGDNFGAGMTGGMAYLYDPDAEHTLRLNGETVIVVPVLGRHWEAQLRRLVERHARETGSPRGGRDPAALGGGAAEVPPDRAEGDADAAGASAERRGGGGDGLRAGGDGASVAVEEREKRDCARTSPGGFG